MAIVSSSVSSIRAHLDTTYVLLRRVPFLVIDFDSSHVLTPLFFFQAAVAAAVPVLFVQLKIFTLAESIYLQLYKSKGPADRNFGTVENALSAVPCAGQPHLAHIIEKLVSNTSTNAYMRFNAMNPYAVNKIKEHVFNLRFGNLTPTGAFPTKACFKEVVCIF